MPYIGRGPELGVRSRFIYTATANQTSFSGNDDAGISLAYTDTLYMDVYQNGVLLVPATDYAATTGTSVVLVQGASVDDTVELLVFDIFSVADSVSAKDGGSFAGNVGMGGTLGVTGVLTTTAATVHTNGITMPDSAKAIFGAGSDLEILHDGNSVIRTISASAGDLYLTAQGTGHDVYITATDDISIRPQGGENGIKVIGDGAVELYHNSVKKLETTATGVHVNGGTNATFTLEGDASAGASFINFAADGAATKAQISAAKEGGSGGDLKFSTNNSSGTITERMRIDAAGNVLVGKTASNFASAGIELLATDVVTITRSAATPLNVNRIGSSAGAAIVMHYNGSDVGSIDVAASSTSYNTSSDYRLKENVDYDWDATTRLKQLKPARFNFIVDETNTLVDGFLAHEAQAIVPESVTGTKDAVDDNDVAVMQGIDNSKLVPLLVKTIQELEARIAALEA